MEASLIRTGDEFAGRRDDWNRLLQASAANHIFLTHEWVSAWWRTYGEGREIAVVWVEDEGRPVGIAPLYVERRGFGHGLHAAQLFFLGNRDVGSDFLDLILLPGKEPESIRHILACLKREFDWDRIVLDDIDAESPSVAALRRDGTALGLRPFVRRRFTCPTMSLPASWDEFMDMPDKIFKRIVRREGVKKLWRRHDVELTLAVVKEALGTGLGILFDLHGKRWRDESEAGALSDPKLQAFYRTVSGPLADNGWLRLSIMSIDGTPRVAEYGLRYGDSYYALQGGCDDVGFKLRAGHVLQYKVLESLVGSCATFHFLRGAERYKYQWGCSDRFTVQLALTRTPKGLLMSVSRVAQDKVKRLRRALLKRGRA